MSYIRAQKLGEPSSEIAKDEAMAVSGNRPELDMNLDDEILDFVLALIGKVNALREGEALVVWKEIF